MFDDDLRFEDLLVEHRPMSGSAANRQGSINVPPRSRIAPTSAGKTSDAVFQRRHVMDADCRDNLVVDIDAEHMCIVEL